MEVVNPSSNLRNLSSKLQLSVKVKRRKMLTSLSLSASECDFKYPTTVPLMHQGDTMPILLLVWMSPNRGATLR